MNISNNNSNSHGDHHHRNAGIGDHHHHHHHLHSNGSSSSSSFIGDLLSGDAGDTAESHFRSRLSLVQDENAINFRSPPAGAYPTFPHAHFPLVSNGMPFSHHHHHSIVPVVEELMSQSSHGGYHTSGPKGTQNPVPGSFYQQHQQHLASDNSPVPATSATTLVASSSSSSPAPPPTSALPSASSSPPKRPFAEYDHHPSAYQQQHTHNEAIGGGGGGGGGGGSATAHKMSNMSTSVSLTGSGTFASHLNGNCSTAAPASILTGIAGAKVPLADHNGQQSSFSENVSDNFRIVPFQ